MVWGLLHISTQYTIFFTIEQFAKSRKEFKKIIEIIKLQQCQYQLLYAIIDSINGVLFKVANISNPRGFLKIK